MQLTEPTDHSTTASASAPAEDLRLEGTILVVDDDDATCEMIETLLGKTGLHVISRSSPQDALDLVQERDFDAIITDLSMSRMSGLELTERILGTRPHVPVLVITGHGTMEAAVAAIRVGAYDFITKPLDAKLLSLSMERALKHRRLDQEVRRLRQNVERIDRPESIIGSSTAVKRLLDMIDRLAESETSVLIYGESGTGKELVAKEIHDRSSRKNGPFMAINCAAVPPSLLESELFGHAKGAFTDAKNAKAGLFSEADGGTLFLDEIGELPLEMQAKLLRALQERRVRPVGSSTEVPFNARILAATNRDLEEEIRARRFREDLFYRINVVRVDVPPLRDRADDVLIIAEAFIGRCAARSGKRITGLARDAAQKLRTYDWPGNVRELENCIERAVALAPGEQLMLEDLPDRVRNYEPHKLVLTVDEPSELVTVDELERRYVMRVLTLLDGNKSRAAQVLGVDRRTLYRKLDRWSAGSSNGSSSHDHLRQI